MPQQDLDPIIHSQTRLAILSALSSIEQIDFTQLRDKLGTTDGNLSIHLMKLEEAGHVEILKQEKKPKTLCQITEKGREAFVMYLQNLKELLGQHLQ